MDCTAEVVCSATADADVAAASAVAFADVSNYKDTIHTANELPLGETRFLILYLLV